MGSFRVLRLPLFKNMHVSVIDDSKLTVGVSVSLHGMSSLSLCLPCDGLKTCSGCTCHLSSGGWDGLQPLIAPDLV